MTRRARHRARGSSGTHSALVLDRHFAQIMCKIDMIGQGAAAGAGELLQILDAAMDFQRDPDAGADAAAYVFVDIFFFDQHRFVAHEGTGVCSR